MNFSCHTIWGHLFSHPLGIKSSKENVLDHMVNMSLITELSRSEGDPMDIPMPIIQGHLTKSWG